jgi:uncharacterized protein (DUF779 family)
MGGGTLYSTSSNLQVLAVFDVWEEIDLLFGSMCVLPLKDFMVGLDEIGKGEVMGHTVFVGVMLPKEIFKKIDLIVGLADTRRSVMDLVVGMFYLKN